MRSFAPALALKTRVLAIDIIESQGGESVVMPSTSAVLGLQFRGRVRAGEGLLSVAGITGLQSHVRSYSYIGETGSVLVRFTPQGAASVGVAASELTDRSVPLDDFLPAARVAELSERLYVARDDRARLELVHDLLLQLPFSRDPLVTRTIELLSSGSMHDAASVATVARLLGVSERQLERRFLARVGLTPKRFAKLQRFERAVAIAKSNLSLAAVAQQAGYYDQSHFIRDFHGFVGATPGEALSNLR